MLYGLNFGRGEIPAGWARRFVKRIPIAWLPRGNAYRLVGVATNRESLKLALMQADNGRRLLHVEERQAASGPCFGIYAY